MILASQPNLKQIEQIDIINIIVDDQNIPLSINSKEN